MVLVVRAQALALGLIERHRLAVSRHIAAAIEHGVEGALGDDPVPARVVLGNDHDGQALAQEIVGDLVDLGHRAQLQAPFLGVADDRGIERVVDPRLQRGIDQRQAAHALGVGARRIDGGAQLHHALGERAGLVRAQDVDAAEVLDGLQPAHDDALARHRRAPDDSVTLTMAGSSSGDRPTARATANSSESTSGRCMQQIDGEHEQHHHHHHPREKVAELAQAVGELRLGRRAGEAAGDLAEFGAQPGLHDQDLGRAAPDRRSEKHRVRALRQRGVGGDAAGSLLDREGFAREGRLRDQEVPAFEHHAVCRHEVAGAELDHIARHDAPRIERSPHSVPAAPSPSAPGCRAGGPSRPKRGTPA